MGERRASDLLVECLQAEGVREVFGIPGEETLDVNESLSTSPIGFVPVRHEQAAALMAAMHGRLTGRPGVCLATLGPGATNLVSGVAHAYLERMPLVALSAQAGAERRHKESHQHIDILALLKPVTKWSARVSDPATLPEVVRKAFSIAQAEKPGPTHIELPEDVMSALIAGRPLRAPAQRHAARPAPEDVAHAAGVICAARKPALLVGNGVLRTGATDAVRAFAAATQIGAAETFMAKGAGPGGDLARGTVGLNADDYELAGLADADVVITIGYDLVEHAPSFWNPHSDKVIVCIDTVPPEVDAHFVSVVDLIGDLPVILAELTTAVSAKGGGPGVSARARLAVLQTAALEAGRNDESVPLRPARVLWELRQALRPEDILVSDVGLHKLWIARLYTALAPDSVFIANGLAGMGVALPSAIAAKRVHPDRNVVTVSGDGGMLMNCQEFETAVRLQTAVVNVVLEDEAFSAIVTKQDKKFGRHFGTDFGGTDFVKLAESFGMPAWRCESGTDFAARLGHALTLDVPSLLVVPIDYSQEVADLASLAEEGLGG